MMLLVILAALGSWRDLCTHYPSGTPNNSDLICKYCFHPASSFSEATAASLSEDYEYIHNSRKVERTKLKVARLNVIQFAF